MEKLVVCTCHRIKIQSQEKSQEHFQEYFFLRNRAPGGLITSDDSQVITSGLYCTEYM